MTKKHFEAIAKRFRILLGSCKNQEAMTALYEIAKGLAAEFSALNSRFDSDRFLKACGF